MRIRIKVILMIFILAWCFHGNAAGQFYFGKNKVQYTDFEWQVMTTRHFKIYFYADESDLAEIAARSGEEAYRLHSARFNHEITSRIPLIIYSHPNYFAQTNVTAAFLPESVAGFTEFLKGRVVVPFDGSYAAFDRVISHELVHVFMFSKINQCGKEYGRYYAASPPLWFIEGLADYWSQEWGSEADLIVRDMVINGTLPSIDRMWTLNGTYFLYKLGQSICRFISVEYGEDKLTRLFDNWAIGSRFEDIVRFTLGESLEKVSEKWAYHLKKEYYPQISSLDLPDKKATRLTSRMFAVMPVPVMLRNRNGGEDPWVIYKANRSGYSALYMQPADSASNKIVTLLKGERSAKYESLHLLTSGVDQYNDRTLIFSSKSQEKDVLYLYDLAEREVTRRYEFDSLVAISSPRFSPDGRQVVFSGSRSNGYTDVYLLTLDGGALERLTADVYNDQDPAFGHDGRSVIFSSDRGGEGSEGFCSLYRFDIASRLIDRLTYGRYHDHHPAEHPDGSRIIFSSDRGEEQAINIYSLDRSGGLAQLTTYITGAFNPRFGQNGDEFYFHAYQNRGFHLFRAEAAAPIVMADTSGRIDTRWQPGRIDSETRSTTVKYRTDYSLDIAQSNIAYEGVYGSIGGIQLAMSDVLGNNTFVFLLSNTARNKDEFLSSFNAGLTYVRRTSRINWGFGAFHLYDEYFNDYDGYYYERLVGGVALASYPLTKFDRLESSCFIRYSDKETMAGLSRRQAVPGTQLFSFVSDNTLWEPTGPLEGRRLNVAVGYSFDFRSGRNFNRLVTADFRHYLRLASRSSWASRFFVFTSAGLEPQRLYFGGSWSFRGYGRRHFYNRNILFNSEEIRFPLIDDLILSFPFGAFRLRGIQGALFHDVGTAWDERWKGWKGSFGVSVRVALWYLVVLRFDFSRTHDFHVISRDTRADFFFGWNF